METTFTLIRCFGSDSSRKSFGTPHFIFLILIFLFGAGFGSFNSLSAQDGGCVMSCPGMDHPLGISIDNDCSDTLEVDQLSMHPDNCTDNYLIQIMENGNDLGNIITQDMINNTYMVIITNIDDNQVCMMTIEVLDKQKPEIAVCPPDVTFECSFDIDSYDAEDQLEVIECSEFTIDSYDEVVFAAECQGDTVTKVNRIYVVTDEYNNSTTCTQMIALIKADLDDVTYPGTVILDCLPEPDLTPDNTGAPMIAGSEISNGLFCNLSFDYFDSEPVDLCSGGRKIFRTFIVTDWCANNASSSGEQIIEVLDRTPPVVVAPPDAVVSTSSDECTADVMLPPAEITEDCSDIASVRIQWPFGTMFSNGGLIEDLPIGVYDIEYIVRNDCDSIGIDTIQITVEDNEPPNPICHQSVSIPVASNGEALISAEALDAASYDNCGPVWFKAKRMTPPAGYDCANAGNPLNQFDDYIKFCCEDIPNNRIMVILRVYDREPQPGPVPDSYLNGRWNECMMEVEVQDKIAPVIECPTPLTVSCLFPFDPDNLSVFGSIAQSPLEREQICIEDPGALTPGLQCIGLDGLAQDNCVAHVDESSIINIDSCGNGSITRTFTVTDDAGFSDVCQQSIEIKNFNPFTEDMIDWPEDFETQNICSVDELDPDDLSYPFNEPVLTAGPCDLVTFNYSDEVYDFSQFDQACFKIIRKWTVIDWCQFDSDGEEGIWVFYQQIKSLNSIPPVFTSANDPIEICSVKENCGPETVTLGASATDDCSSANTLTWRYQIDLDNDGSIEQSIGAGTGESITFDYTFGFGTHRVIYTVFDKCSNQVSKEQFVTITSCTGPSPKCIVGLSTTLMPVDLDDDGTTDWGMVTVWASEFDGGSDHPCGLDFDVAFSTDPNDDSRVYTCDDVGLQVVQLYVIDENGLSDFCVTNIDIQDNSSVCPGTGTGTGQNGFIAGDIKTETLEGVSETMIYLNGSPLSPEQTAGDGAYAFMNMPFGGQYEVEPQKDGDDMNGVSTLDLLRIQRHLLGIENFDSPTQYIAADANRSGTVTAIDILELRKLVLGIYDELPENTSWRFLDDAYEFTDPNNPLAEAFPEKYTIEAFESNMAEVDFTAIKIGDLNGSVKANLVDPALKVRSGENPMRILYQGEQDGAGFTFTAMNMKPFQTAQFSLTWDPQRTKITGLDPVPPFTQQHFNVQDLSNGKLTFAWFGTESFAADQVPLFTLKTQPASKLIASSFRLADDPTPVEASDETGNIRDIELLRGIPVKGAEVKLYQNRPNPFSQWTEIRFDLPESQEVEVSLFDMSGKQLLVRRMDGAKGSNMVRLHKKDIGAKGVIIYELKTTTGVKTRRMIIE